MLTSSEIKEYIDSIDKDELLELSYLIEHRQAEIVKNKWGKANNLFNEMLEKGREIDKLGFHIYLDGDPVDIRELELEAL